MDLNKNDLLRMLFVMEGELQAKEIVISILKNEQIRRLLNPCYDRHRWVKPVSDGPVKNKLTDTIIPNNRANKLKSQALRSSQGFSDTSNNVINNKESRHHQSTYVDPSNPYIALLRDTYGSYDPSFDDDTCKLICNLQYHQLKNLIEQQKRVRNYLESQIVDLQERYNQCFQDLETERSKTTGYDGMVSKIELLQRENSFLRNELENVKGALEKEKEREKAMVLCLITERKQLIVRLIEESQKNSELIGLLQTEKSRTSDLVEGLEEESKRSLQMESEIEVLSGRITSLENKNKVLEEENSKLRNELEAIKSRRLASLGEGVRSTIVTVNSSEHKIVPTVTSVAAINQSQTSVIRPMSPPQAAPFTPSSTRPVAASLPSSTSSQVTYATIQPSKNVAAPQFISNTDNSSSAPLARQSASKPSPSAPSPSTNVSYQNVSQNIGAGKTPPPINTGTSFEVSRGSVSVSPGQVMIATGSPQPPVQKKISSGVVAGPNQSSRGAPPPIPPNKPILPANALKERGKELQTARAKVLSSQSMNLNPVAVQGESGKSNEHNQFSSPPSMLTNGSQNHNKLEHSKKITSPDDCDNVDINCQELDDFQQLLASMELNDNKELESENN